MFIIFCRDAACDDYTLVLFREPFKRTAPQTQQIIYPSHRLIVLFLTFKEPSSMHLALIIQGGNKLRCLCGIKASVDLLSLLSNDYP
jgi:hypothetical protein